MADEATGRWDPGPRPSYQEPLPFQAGEPPPSLEVAPWGRGGGQEQLRSCKTQSRFNWLWALLRVLSAFVRVR